MFKSTVNRVEQHITSFCQPVAFCLILFFLVAPGAASAQAWTLPKGQTYFKLFYGKITSAEQFTFDGRQTDFIDGLPGDTYRDRSLYMYTELGIKDNLSLIFSFPYKRTFVRDHAFRFRLYAPGTAIAGARISLLPLVNSQISNHALSLNIHAFIPTGYVRNYTPSSGGGQVDVQTTLFYGFSLHPLPAYIQAGTGYKYRSSIYSFSKAVSCIPGNDIHCIADTQPQYSDEVTFQAEAGWNFLNRTIFVQAIGMGTWSVKKPSIGFAPLNPIPTEQRYLKVGAGLTLYPFAPFSPYPLSTLGVTVQYFETLAGRNTLSSHDLFVGFEFRPVLF